MTFHFNKKAKLIPSCNQEGIAWVIWLLAMLKKVRLGGFVILLLAFLTNCYFILFDQQNYISFLETFSPDGKISDINDVFMRIQTLIIILSLLLIFITSKVFMDSVLASLKTAEQYNTTLQWPHRASPYISACIFWLLISYLPFLLLEDETIIKLAKEDSFYENVGFLCLFMTSLTFFYLFYRKTTEGRQPEIKPKRNTWFLLLGLLFFFGAGEEINWGQRILHFKTPDIFSSNTQQATSIHNLPVFDWSHDKETAIERLFIMNSMFGMFWFIYCVLVPAIHFISSNANAWLNQFQLPVPPIWISCFFIINYLIYWKVIIPIVGPMKEISEIYETYCVFLFFILSLWLFVNNGRNANAANPQGDPVSNP